MQHPMGISKVTVVVVLKSVTQNQYLCMHPDMQAFPQPTILYT